MSDAARRSLAALLPDVSRETWGQLEAYVEILLKWQKAINLIGPATVDDIWSRHILDSAQVLPHRSEERRVGKECRSLCDWSSDVCSSDLRNPAQVAEGYQPDRPGHGRRHLEPPYPRLGAGPAAQIGRASCRERV